LENTWLAKNKTKRQGNAENTEISQKAQKKKTSFGRFFSVSSAYFLCFLRYSSSNIKTKAPTSGAFWEQGALSSCRDRHGVLVQSAFVGEAHVAIDQSKQAVVFANADVHTGVELGAALAHDDGAGRDQFATKGFYAKHFGL
jgi:hypothetical protein